MTTRHVIVVTYGEPPSPSFVDQLTYSWRILLGLTRTVAKIPPAAIPFIALSRARGRRRLWREQAYRSPLEPITHAQAATLRGALQQADPAVEWKVHVAYEFRHPMVDAILATVPGDDPVWIAPMYAADSAFTHELSRQAAAAAAARQNRRAAVIVLPALEPDALADMSARHVIGCLENDRGDYQKTALVLAAHGTLLEPERPIETGRASTEQLCDAIAARLSSTFGLIANGWLNHTRGGRWTEPPIEETLKRVRDAGFSKVVYYPYGFLADNAESQLEGRLAAAARPELQIQFLPCLNGSAELAAAMARLITGGAVVAPASNGEACHELPAHLARHADSVSDRRV